MAYCVGCGNELTAGIHFCGKCGVRVAGPAGYLDAGLSEERAIATFVGKKLSFYLKKWEVMRVKGSINSWNWAAFFLSLFWLAYRKMYMFSAILVGVIVIESLAEYALGVPDRFSNVVGVIVSVVCSMQGNYWYKRHVERTVRDVMAQKRPVEETIAELARRGGTSVLAALGLLVAVMACVALVVGATEGFN
jgi:hypothetical protein